MSEGEVRAAVAYARRVELTNIPELPHPKVPYINKIASQADNRKSEAMSAASTPKPTPRKQRQDSFGGDPTSDPWAASPLAGANIPPPSTAAHTMPVPHNDDFSTASTNGAGRTTSTFTTSDQQISASASSVQQSQNGGGGGWNSYNGSSTDGFSEPSGLGGGFGGDGEQPRRSDHASQPSASGSIVIPPGTGEAVVVTMLPEKEGMFLFQHRNYEVKTIRRGSSVVRRYSDFVWLLDCLQKRYPFRRLPLLPPKRVQGKSNRSSSSG